MPLPCHLSSEILRSLSSKTRWAADNIFVCCIRLWSLMQGHVLLYPKCEDDKPAEKRSTVDLEQTYLRREGISVPPPPRLNTWLTLISAHHRIYWRVFTFRIPYKRFRKLFREDDQKISEWFLDHGCGMFLGWGNEVEWWYWGGGCTIELNVCFYLFLSFFTFWFFTMEWTKAVSKGLNSKPLTYPIAKII